MKHLMKLTANKDVTPTVTTRFAIREAGNVLPSARYLTYWKHYNCLHQFKFSEWNCVIQSTEWKLKGLEAMPFSLLLFTFTCVWQCFGCFWAYNVFYVVIAVCCFLNNNLLNFKKIKIFIYLSVTFHVSW